MAITLLQPITSLRTIEYSSLPKSVIFPTVLKTRKRASDAALEPDVFVYAVIVLSYCTSFLVCHSCHSSILVVYTSLY